jgi:hypothetical protein
MSEHPTSSLDHALIRETIQKAVDFLLFLSDEFETRRLPATSPEGSLRLAALLLSLERDLT